MKRISLGFAVMTVLALAVEGQTGDCNAGKASGSATIELPAHPFGVKSTRDGCWVFVTLMGNEGGRGAGIAVLKRGEGGVALARVVPLKSRPTGIALTHDGKLLIAAALNRVIFLDVQAMTRGDSGAVVGEFSDGANASSIYTNVSPDDKLLFVSEERARSITVIDLERARANGYKADAILGRIPTGNAPIALTFSLDGKWLYTTSEGAAPEWGWPKACVPEGRELGGANLVNPEGAVIVVDVERARSDARGAVVARVPAGCSPVRMAISPGGERIYVTARNSNAVLEFDTAKLVTDGAHARLGSAKVGSAPVPIAVIDGGKKLVVGNSNRFGGSNEPQSLLVLDVAKIQEGMDALAGKVPAGVFPREMDVTSDGRALLVTNFGSNSLQVVNLERK